MQLAIKSMIQRYRCGRVKCRKVTTAKNMRNVNELNAI